MSDHDPLRRFLPQTRPERPEADESTYRAIVTQTRPQMGFSVTQADGEMHGFLYHNLDNLNYQVRGGKEFLSFTHRAKAVTVQGKGLKTVFGAIMRHVLAELNEPDGRPAKEGLPTIQRIQVDTVGQAAPGTSPAARLVK